MLIESVRNDYVLVEWLDPRLSQTNSGIILPSGVRYRRAKIILVGRGGRMWYSERTDGKIERSDTIDLRPGLTVLVNATNLKNEPADGIEVLYGPKKAEQVKLYLITQDQIIATVKDE